MAGTGALQGGVGGTEGGTAPHGPLPEREVTVFGDMEVRRLWVRPGGTRGDHAQVGAGCAQWPQVPGALRWGASRTPRHLPARCGKTQPSCEDRNCPLRPWALSVERSCQEGSRLDRRAENPVLFNRHPSTPDSCTHSANKQKDSGKASSGGRGFAPPRSRPPRCSRRSE